MPKPGIHYQTPTVDLSLLLSILALTISSIALSRSPAPGAPALEQAGTPAAGGSGARGWVSVNIYDGAARDVKIKERWTSQFGQDRSIADIFSLRAAPRKGFFVELAANDAVFLSNSLTLEQEFGWAGLCIEANPHYIPGYRA